MIVKSIIGVLAAIVLVLLYRGMQRDYARPDPMAPVSSKKILSVMRAQELQCDTVDSYTPLGKNDQDYDVYMVRCHDGGRFLYFDHPGGHMGAASCQDEAFHYGYRCPN